MHVANMPAWTRVAHPFLRAAVLATLISGSVAGSAAAQETVPPAATKTVQDAATPAQAPAAAPSAAAATPLAQAPAGVEPSTRSPAAQPQPALPSVTVAPEASFTPPIEKAAVKGHDMSPLGMFLHADIVVQGVMVLLAVASMATWVVLLVKGIGLFFAKRRMRAAIAGLRGAGSLAEASSRIRNGVAVRLVLEAEEELGISHGLPGEGIKERVAIALHRIEVSVAKRMAVGTGILATTGSIGPFVGLFGTVWGIMHSFIGIAQTNTTNLAVVAPGIAEALLATGIGLVAAIPAVVFYNVLTRSIGAYRMLVGDAVALVMRHLSRDLDRRTVETYASKVVLRVAAE